MHDLAKDFIAKRDCFARMLGIELVEVGPGRATARMPLTSDHCNGLGVAHGGATFTLADLAFAAAANSRGQVAVGINASINYVAAGQGEHLTARAEETSLTPKLATYKVTITDDTGTVVALFDGMAYRKRTSVPEAMGMGDGI